MNLKKYLEKRIHGWLPKEPNLSSFPTATSRKNEHSHKIKLPIGTVLLLSLFMLMFIAQFFEGNATGALFLWFSCILGLSLALDILMARGKELNEKFVAGLWLLVTSLGGIVANLYIFSMTKSFFTRIFSLSVLALLHVPFLIALIAYVRGKKELSKKLINWFSSGS
jgi:peptidoglycan/LPS O-acetylase OafA/YrhL